MLKRLAEDPAIAAGVTTPGLVRRFWEVCQLPDFRQQGPDTHARFVARLWQDLREGHLGADYVAARVAELGRTEGDIDTLQGRIAAIRSWAYICQRPDWVLARDEMGARARDAERRLSDALHQRLTERFVNRRTAILMKTMGKDAALLRVALDEAGRVLVEDQPIGHLEGFRFVVDAEASHEDRKLMLAAAEKHLPQLLAMKAQALVRDELGELTIEQGEVRRDGPRRSRGSSAASRRAGRGWCSARSSACSIRCTRRGWPKRSALWLEGELAPLAPLRAIEDAALSPEAGSEVRALLLTLAGGHGAIAREDAGLAHVAQGKAALAAQAWRHHRRARRVRARAAQARAAPPAARDRRRPAAAARGDGGGDRGRRGRCPPAIAAPAARRSASTWPRSCSAPRTSSAPSARAAGSRSTPALATSMGLQPDNFRQLMRDAGFRPGQARAAARRRVRPARAGLVELARRRARTARRPSARTEPAREGGAFAALAGLVR